MSTLVWNLHGLRETLLSLSNTNVWAHCPFAPLPCPFHSHPIRSALVGLRQLHDIGQVHIVSLQELADESHGLSATPGSGSKATSHGGLSHFLGIFWGIF